MVKLKEMYLNIESIWPFCLYEDAQGSGPFETVALNSDSEKTCNSRDKMYLTSLRQIALSFIIIFFFLQRNKRDPSKGERRLWC